MSFLEALMKMRDIMVQTAFPVLKIILELWPDQEAVKELKREFTIIKSGPDPGEKKESRKIYKIEQAYYRYRRKP